MPTCPGTSGASRSKPFSSPGFWPLSPVAFPGALPFQSFAADSLVSVTFRYLPFQIHAFTYSQVLFCWAIALWTAVVLIAQPGVWRSLVVLSVALLAVPILIFGPGSVGSMVFVFFLANPNSLIAWPIGLGLTFHLYRSFRRHASPSWFFLVLLPPASLFFKTNQAVSFGFLQAVGFASCVSCGRHRDLFKWGLWAAGAWAAAILLAGAMGPSPVSLAIHPSLANLHHYVQVTFPDVPSLRHALARWLLCVIVAAAISAAAALPRRDVVAPLAALTASIAYVLAGWWLVVPNGPTEGEPMHVNNELIMWIATVIIASTSCGVYDTHGRVWSVRTLLAASVSSVALGLWGFMAWSLNRPLAQLGNFPLEYRYSMAFESDVRGVASSRIADGNCFWYGRRYAIDAGSRYDPDGVIAATGCPVINGQRWRGYLGENQPDALRSLQTIPVPPRGSFELIAIQ